MKTTKFPSLIKNNFIFIALLSNFIFQFVQTFYVFPFKILKPELSSLYKEFPKNTKEEVYLSHLNLGTIFTYAKTGNSKIFELIFKVSEKCSFQTNSTCISNYKSNTFDKFSHNNINISNIINSILNNSSPKEECTDIKIGLAMPGYNGKDTCISIINEIKKNDDTTNSTAYYFNFYNEKEIKEKGCDGEIILGAEPYEYEKDIYKEEDFISVYNHVNEYYYTGDFWDGKYVNYSFVFKQIYYYINNNNTNQSENIRYVQGSDSTEAALDFELGLIKAPTNYFTIMVINFFSQYIKDNSCKETTISGGYKGILCYKNKLNVKFLYEHFPTIYFDNVYLNYTFILDSNDLFIEKDDIIYFAIISQNEKINNWKFGQRFLKKYKLVFNNDKKAIECFIKYKEKESNGTITDNGNNGNNKIKDRKLHYGIIILIIGIVLFIGEIIAAVICIKKGNCLNRRKRANELMDDNYDYPTVNPEENKVIN